MNVGNDNDQDQNDSSIMNIDNSLQYYQQNKENYNIEYSQAPLLSFRLEVSNGIFDSLNINKDGNVAQELDFFCQRHHLSDKTKGKLNNQVINQLNNLIESSNRDEVCFNLNSDNLESDNHQDSEINIANNNHCDKQIDISIIKSQHDHDQDTSNRYREIFESLSVDEIITKLTESFDQKINIFNKNDTKELLNLQLKKGDKILKIMKNITIHERLNQLFQQRKKLNDIIKSKLDCINIKINEELENSKISNEIKNKNHNLNKQFTINQIKSTKNLQKNKTEKDRINSPLISKSREIDTNKMKNIKFYTSESNLNRINLNSNEIKTNENNNEQIFKGDQILHAISCHRLKKNREFLTNQEKSESNNNSKVIKFDQEKFNDKIIDFKKYNQSNFNKLKTNLSELDAHHVQPKRNYILKNE